MKANRWWLRGLPIRRLGKYIRGTIFQDGTGYSLHQWDTILAEMRGVSVEDTILNPYKMFEPTTIKRVEYTWAPIQHKEGSRIVGCYVDGFTIFTEDDYLLNDPPSEMISIQKEHQEALDSRDWDWK